MYVLFEYVESLLVDFRFVNFISVYPLSASTHSSRAHLVRWRDDSQPNHRFEEKYRIKVLFHVIFWKNFFPIQFLACSNTARLCALNVCSQKVSKVVSGNCEWLNEREMRENSGWRAVRKRRPNFSQNDKFTSKELNYDGGCGCRAASLFVASNTIWSQLQHEFQTVYCLCISHTRTSNPYECNIRRLISKRKQKPEESERERGRAEHVWLT